MTDPVDRLVKNLRTVAKDVRDERVYGILGRGANYTDIDAPRKNNVWITLGDGHVINLPNIGSGHVPHRAGLRVKMIRKANGALVLDGQDDRFMQDDGNQPTAYGVLPHPFISHTDVPSSYEDQAGKVVRVNEDEDGLEFHPLITDDIPEGATNLYYTDERAQDAAAAMAAATATITPTYTGATPELKWDVNDASITNAKQATMAADTMKGNFTALTAAPTDASVPTVLAQYIHAATTKATPATGDELGATDSAASYALKKFSFQAIRDTIKSYYDSVVATLTNKSIDASTNTLTNINTSALANDAVSNAKLANMGANTVKANATGSTADPSDVDASTWMAQYTHGATTKATPATGDEIATADSAASFGLKKFSIQAIRDFVKGYYDSVVATLTNKSIDASANTLTNIDTSALANDAVSNAKLANMADSTVKGQIVGGSGDPVDLTKAQLIAIIEAQALYALLAGRSGGQVQNGGTAANENLTLSSTAHATKGKILFGASAYDEANNRLGIGASDPAAQLEVVSTSTGNTRGLILGQYNSAAQAFLLIARKAAGTRASPAIVGNGYYSGAYFFQFYDGAAYLTTGSIGAVVNGTPASGSIATDLVFAASATNDTGFTNEILRLLSSGKASIGGLSSIGASQLGIKAGTSINDAAVGGLLYASNAALGNVLTGEDVIGSYVVPVNTLSVNGQSLELEAWGTTVNNANSKRFRVRFGTAGTNLILDTIAAAPTGAIYNWHLVCRVIRTGASTQDAFAHLSFSNPLNGASSSFITDVVALTQTLTSGTITFEVTGEATATNDIVCNNFAVEWKDANT